MLAAVFYKPGDLRLVEVDTPSAGPGELLLRMHVTATCGTDAKIFKHGHLRLDPPQVLGHELAGEVVGVGQETRGFSIGDRVQVIAAVPCGDCWACADGLAQICTNQTSMGYQYAGGFAEFMVVPAQALRVGGVNHIPDSLGYAEASLTEPLACVLNAQDFAGVGSGDTVVVMGAGPIGCLHVRLARARGAASVILTDINGQRLRESSARVAPDASIEGSGQPVIDAVRNLTEGRGPTVVITAAPSGQAQEDAIAMAAPRARISFFGGLPRDNPFIRCDANAVHYRELTLLGANGSSPDHNRRALALIASGDVPVADLITHRLPLDQVHEAIRLMTSGEAIKVVVEPSRRQADGVSAVTLSDVTPADTDVTGAVQETTPPTGDDLVVSRTVPVGSRVGLHARPAATIVKAAGAQAAVVTLTTGAGRSADARSMLSVLALGADHGDEVTVTATGEGAREAVAALAELIMTELDS